MENNEKYCTIYSNGFYIIIVPCVFEDSMVQEYNRALVMSVNNVTLCEIGKVCLEKLNEYRELPLPEVRKIFPVHEYVKMREELARVCDLTLDKFDSTMMHLSCLKLNDGFCFHPTKKKGKSWEAMVRSFSISIPLTSSPEIIGATIKFMISRCTGTGAYSVAKKLFPDGVPETFDEYLESLRLKN